MRAVLVTCLLATAASAAPVRTFQDEPHPGMRRERWEDAAIPARIHVVRVDLTSAEISLFATSEADSGIKTSTFAARKGAQLAINGGPFAVANYRPLGLAMGDGQLWSTSDDEQTFVLHFKRGVDRIVATIITDEVVTPPSSLPPNTEAVVSGRPLLVRNGVAQTAFAADPITIPSSRAPRSAVGLSMDGYLMWLVTVDGWQSGSVGMTAAELAAFIRARGAHNAIGLDIGGSSTMIVNGQPESSPSDGIERPVANHIAVQAGPPKFGALTGAICKNNVINCDESSERIFGVRVRLDTGDIFDVTSTNQLYFFDDVTPRYTCVTATKLGYRTATACTIVKVGKAPPTYNSLVLEPGDDPVDAGIPDASEVPIDADDGVDAPPRPDAGNPDMGPGPGCCNTGGDHPPTGLVVLVAVVAFRVGRRRGTKA